MNKKLKTKEFDIFSCVESVADFADLMLIICDDNDISSDEKIVEIKHISNKYLAKKDVNK